MSAEMDVEGLARSFHHTYERLSAGYEWQTQESCRVEFDDLPPQNRALMLAVCQQIYAEYFMPQAEENERLRKQVSAAGEQLQGHHMNLRRVQDALEMAPYSSLSETLDRIATLTRQLQEAVEERDRLRRQLDTPTHYWSEDANCMEGAIEWEDFYLLEDCVALEPGAHVDFEVTPLIVLPDRKVRVRRTADGEYESEALTERSNEE